MRTTSPPSPVAAVVAVVAAVVAGGLTADPAAVLVAFVLTFAALQLLLASPVDTTAQFRADLRRLDRIRR